MKNEIVNTIKERINSNAFNFVADWTGEEPIAFHREGKLICLGQHRIEEYTNDLILDDGKFYKDDYYVGLDEDECQSGIGYIDIDGGYDTTYTCRLKNLSKQEIKLLCELLGYEGSSALAYYCKGMTDNDIAEFVEKYNINL